ncbi:hypothetical protein F5144DRAFT_620833 [Chaetomium tenue]|uniref:Uncharacterized protein n=1 Tax=Chaetomium tenue TaxID=1854479 RepID=A0ACB7P8X3_9PEZI|nr:hypothetical protein F5144DRAFT_620833 [Chaetomium globosum]
MKSAPVPLQKEGLTTTLSTMPVPVAAKVGIVVASVAVTAAIAIYEIPEVRRATEDLRRRIALALHSLGDNFDPNREPRFNRPEDADGFYQSHDVDADEETRRRQREELMYWNLRREEQQRDHPEVQQRPRGSTFDDFLQPDRTGDSGAFVYNTGANAWDSDSPNVLRRRGNVEGVRGLNAAMITNPFSDEHGIELDDRAEMPPPTRAEVMSDIYGATPRVLSPSVPQVQPIPVQPLAVPVASEVLFDFETHNAPSEYATAVDEDYQDAKEPPRTATPTATSRSTTIGRELADDEYMTAGQDDRNTAEAYASIQAWAQNSSGPGFYSPLPDTPQAPLSDPEVISQGQLTPTDSMSMAGSGVDVGNDDVSMTEGRDYDVMSESDGGAHTPGSWSEVASVVSESESVVRA